MEKEQVVRLSTHVSQITNTLIQQIGSDGIIRTFVSETSTVPDVVASHHLIELLNELDGSLFAHELEAMISWMFEPKHGLLDDPFAIDSFSQVCGVTDENTKLLRDSLFDSRLTDGSFTKYTAHMRGGDFFSTLWCTKILLNYSVDVFEEAIHDSLSYLIGRYEVAARDTSQRGFLALLLMRTDHTRYAAEIGKLMGDIHERLDTLDFTKLNGTDLLEALYLLEDCARYAEIEDDPDAMISVTSALNTLFELDRDPEKIPDPIERVQGQCVQSLYYQILCRSCILGQLACKGAEYRRVHLDVNELVHGEYRRTRYVAIAAQSQLKKYLEIYGAIHKKFGAYNEQLDAIWERTPFERSVFMMMPFKQTAEYRLLTEALKKECEANGFHAIRVDDDDRSFSDRLWDNLIINMLSCKYAVSVYVSDPVVDQLTEQIKIFANPNVALEFGFFCSRGQEILILKDKRSPLPSDLQGFLWNDFDIQNPDQTVGEPIRKWLDRLKSDEAEQ